MFGFVYHKNSLWKNANAWIVLLYVHAMLVFTGLLEHTFTLTGAIQVPNSEDRMVYHNSILYHMSIHLDVKYDGTAPTSLSLQYELVVLTPTGYGVRLSRRSRDKVYRTIDKVYTLRTSGDPQNNKYDARQIKLHMLTLCNLQRRNLRLRAAGRNSPCARIEVCYALLTRGID